MGAMYSEIRRSDSIPVGSIPRRARFDARTSPLPTLVRTGKKEYRTNVRCILKIVILSTLFLESWLSGCREAPLSHPPYLPTA
jgi:hypothetical protein